MEKSNKTTDKILAEKYKFKPEGVRRFASNKEALSHVRKTLEELHSSVLQSVEGTNGRQ